MSRICAYPDCKKGISQLPESHILCTKHQIEFKIFVQDVENWNNGNGQEHENDQSDKTTLKEKDRLEQADYFFLFRHKDGCSAQSLDRYLTKEIGSTSAKSALRRGYLQGTRNRLSWEIPFDEELRAISLARNWVSIRQVGKANKINAYNFFGFVKDNRETRINLSGALSIRKSEVADSVNAYKIKVFGSRRGARSFARFAKHDETSPGAFGEMFSTSDVTVRNWIKRGHVKAVRRKSSLFIKKREIKAFATKAINGEIPTTKIVMRRCHEVLAS